MSEDGDARLASRAFSEKSGEDRSGLLLDGPVTATAGMLRMLALSDAWSALIEIEGPLVGSTIGWSSEGFVSSMGTFMSSRETLGLKALTT